MDNHVIWWVLGLALVVAELFSGTFYLLMVAIGFAAAGVVAIAGGSVVLQLIVGAAVGLVAVLGLHKVRGTHVDDKPDAARNRDLVLDIGESVHVSAWDQRRAKVQYRGAQWDAHLAEGETSTAPGDYRILGVEGSVLVLGRGA